ncbi:MAG: AAA family ATPase [bacterium]
MQNELHQKVFEFLEDYRKINPKFYYWLRKSNRSNRLTDGFWFQGREEYAFVGLYDASGGSNMTQSFGLVFMFEKGEYKCKLENAFNDENKPEILYLYEEIRNYLGDFQYENKTKYFKNLNGDAFKEAKKFLDNQKPEIDRLIKKNNLESIFISEKSFTDRLSKILELQKINYTNKNMVSISTKNENINDYPLNQILYGPPGTGKTYKTIDKALEIIGENLNNKDRKEIKSIYNQKVKEGQIIFTTFHQSMSYEDFIEGIKPIVPENEGAPVIYKIEDGIFKNLCIESLFEMVKLNNSPKINQLLDFSDLYNSYLTQIEEQLLLKEEIKLTTKTDGNVLIDGISELGNIIIKHVKGDRTYTVSKDRLNKLFLAYPNIENLINIHNQFREIIGGCNATAYWAVLNAIMLHKKSTVMADEERPILFEDKKELISTLETFNYENQNTKRYVLIIDEINRGNVSQIFGELITLIEEDKRLGKSEALEAILPYSKEKFGVPPNLYIIGTMNTADRSVEALDTALRRRFDFVEMLPDYSLIKKHNFEEYSLSEILETINNRIEKLLDKDHIIGHSYFIFNEDKNINIHLSNAFYKKIIPLLQEYFFGDFGKIGLVLGNGFIKKKELENNLELFADFEYDNKSDFDERIIYEIIDYRMNSSISCKINNKTTELTFEKAVKLLMNDQIE